MSKHHKEIGKLLAIGHEHFQEEVRCLSVTVEHLTPMQMLQAIQHAELRMGYTFTDEDFSEGRIGGMMIPEDFNFEENEAKLLAERKRAFQEELSTMSSALRAQFEQGAKEYKDLPEDTPVVDHHKLVGLDLKNLSKAEKSSERMLHDMQEWMLQEKSSAKCAVLPEESMQKILVGACNQLEITCHVEQMALNLRFDAIRTMKAALAGTATTKFLDVLEAAFGEEKDEELVPELDPTAKESKEDDIPAEAIVTKEEADLEGEPSTSTQSLKRTTRSSTRQPPVKRFQKQERPTKSSGPFPIKDALPVYPSKKNKKTYLHVGVPDKNISSRESGPFSKLAIYRCQYAWAEREAGRTPQECDVICQSCGQTSTHIRQHHMNICVCCYYCGHRWWSAFQWKKHMQAAHTDLDEDDWFTTDEIPASTIIVKTKVEQKDLEEAMRGEPDDKGEDDDDDA